MVNKDGTRLARQQGPVAQVGQGRGGGSSAGVPGVPAGARAGGGRRGAGGACRSVGLRAALAQARGAGWGAGSARLQGEARRAPGGEALRR